VIPNPNSWVYPKVVESVAMPSDQVALVSVVQRPIVLGPSQSLNDLTLVQQLERGIDWEATGRRSAVIMNLRKESV
jgi:hypothetical protein